MKVKELAEIFREDIEELIKLLDNVGVKADAETNIDKDIEKKLAKRYNVPYPFKKSKPKVDQKQTEKPQPTPQPQQPVKPQRSSEKQSTKPSKPAPQPTSKPAPKATKPESSKPEPKQPKVETKKPVTRPKFEDDIVVPKVDEETLRKYEHFLEDDEYNITREKGKKKGAQDRSADTGEYRRRNVKIKRNKNERRTSNVPKAQEFDQKTIYYEKGMTTIEVAEALGISVTELVKKLFLSLQVMATATQILDRDIIELVAMEYGFEVKDKVFTDLTRFEKIEIIDDEEELVSRPPVVTIMGHVDHGKTTLLDTIRHSRVVKGEAGGITQHIGAYQVNKDGQIITFIDTPGHAAFTEMRARGAQITDIVILVVAADDGVMPQTKEAIEHAQAAKVPIIVAINKMDKPGVNPDRIKQELTQFNLIPEEWGGSTIFVNLSALTGDGVDELLEMIILVSELEQYRANPNRLGVGTVIEAKLDKGRGPVATLLVQNGTIKIGDPIVVGTTYGKIRAMHDENGNLVKAAGPSKPVEVTGIEQVPNAGERFIVLEDEKSARSIADERAYRKFNEEKGVGKPISLTELFKNQKDDSIKELNLIIKCDVQGSIEAIKGVLGKIDIEGTNINFVSARVGAITETDINLALVSNAIVIGFNIRPMANIADLAKEKGVEIRLYDVIYKLQEDIEKALKGMLDPVYEEKVIGQAEVREIFKVSRIGTIGGCYVTSGHITRNSGVRLIRDGKVIYTGNLSTLKRFKDDVREVRAGYECGLTIENYNDIKQGDVIEAFIMEEVERD
ncbi:MAG TPA: translation initiation factor IF-2 [Acholeplasmataceae bacterium]|jgi:translation initiation factor IF-2|nr:translation initiation factor IF-2 [Acholeplasmataceae bacterium]